MASQGGSSAVHRYLILGRENVLEFKESGARPRIAFTEEYIRVGCHKISREAWELLNKKYEEFHNKNREEVMQEGNY